MANAGRILIMPKGAYDASTTYEMLDLVTHNDVVWLAKKAVIGIEPSEDNSEHWFKMVDSKNDEKLDKSGGEMTGDLTTQNVVPSVNHKLSKIGDEGNAYFGGHFNNLTFETFNGAKAGKLLTVDDVLGNGGMNMIMLELGDNTDNTAGAISVRGPEGGTASVTASGNGSADIYFPPTSGTLALKEETLPLIGGIIDNRNPEPMSLRNSAGTEVKLCFSGADDVLGYFGFDGTDNAIVQLRTGWAKHKLLHTGNKPSGSYTGNGSATQRTIDIGGTNDYVLIEVIDTCMILVGTGGAYCFNKEGTITYIASTLLKAYQGKMYIATDNWKVNGNGMTFRWIAL